MTALDTNELTEQPTEVRPRWRRRRPAPRAHPFFRFVFPLLVVVAGVAVLLLWSEGTKAVLDTTDGAAVPFVTDPAEPGFIAFATPTPTILVAHTDDTDELLGVTILARTALDAGGSLAIFSADLLLDLEEDVILGRNYAEEGIDGLERVIGELMGFGFTEEPMVMDPTRLALFLTLVEPIPFRLVDDLVEGNGEGGVTTVHEARSGDFDGAALASIYGWRNPSERDAGRFTRQLAIWDAWLARIGEADDLLAATLPFDEGLPPFLRSLGAGTLDAGLAPMSPLGFDPDSPIYTLTTDNFDWPETRAMEMVPLPVAHTPGARPTVQLLDGTGDPTNRELMLPIMVAAGAEISVIGNAPSFGVEETIVAYHDPKHEVAATELADAIDAPVVFDKDPNQPADLTVTIGTDRVPSDGSEQRE